MAGHNKNELDKVRKRRRMNGYRTIVIWALDKHDGHLKQPANNISARISSKGLAPLANLNKKTNERMFADETECKFSHKGNCQAISLAYAYLH